MGKGPEETRFDKSVQGMSQFDVSHAASEWRTSAQRLTNVAVALRDAAPKMHNDFGGETGATAQQAFEKGGASADRRAQEMNDVADALDRAGSAMSDAQRAHAAMGDPPAEPAPFTPSGDGDDIDDMRRMQSANRQKASYDSAMADRERQSRAEADKLDAAYRDAMGAMKKAHGEHDPTSGGTGGGSGTGAGGSSGGGGAAGGGGGGIPTASVPSHTSGGGHSGQTIETTGPGTSTGSGTSGGSGTTAPGGGGAAQPGGATAPAASTGPGSALGGSSAPTYAGGTGSSPIGSIPGGSTSGSIGAPAAGGVAGALGGGMIGGAAGITGAVRGGGITAVPTGAASAGSARPIGSTARGIGSSGSLSRSAVAGTAGSPTGRSSGSRGVAGRAGAAGRGAVGSGGQAGSRGKAGAGGRAGARGTGSATGGGKGRKKDKRSSQTDEFFEEVQDWIDDEGIAPEVLD